MSILNHYYSKQFAIVREELRKIYRDPDAKAAIEAGNYVKSAGIAT